MNARAVAAALAAAVLWALTGIFVRALDGVPLGALVWARFALSLVLLLPLTLLPGRTGAGDTTSAGPGAVGTTGLDQLVVPAGPDERADPTGAPAPAPWRAGRLPDLGLAACMTVYYICATAGFALGPVALTALVIALTPTVTLVWQAATTHRVEPRELSGFVIAIVGVALYLGPLLGGTAQFGEAAILGAVGAATVATVVRALYTILVWRRARDGVPVHAQRVNRMTFSLGAVACLPVFALQAPGLAWSARDAGLLAALVVAATIAPNLLNTWASARLAPTANAIIGMLTPPVAGLLGWALLDEPLTGTQAPGMAVALAGVAVATLRWVRPRPRARGGPGRRVAGHPRAVG